MTTNTITAYAEPEAGTMTANAEPQAEPKKAGPEKAARKKAEPKADVKKANVFCLQENLAKGLSIVGRAAVSRATLPVLSNVLIAADGARLKLSATNLEVAITCWIGAQIENGEFAITIPARTFSETITTMPKGGVEMALDAGTQTLTVRGDHAVSTVKGIDATEFPILPMQEGGISLSAEAFKNALGDVIYAAATDEARPVLTGVLLKIEKNTRSVTLVATDGFRLAKSELQLSAPQEAVSVIVPASALAKLRQIIAGDQLILSFQNNQALFRFNTEDMEIQLAANLLEGNYPEYAALFPPGHTTKVTVPAEAILMACKVAHIFARENNGSMATLDVSPSTSSGQAGGVKVSATSAETGSNESNVVATVEGEALKINLNMRYGIDAFSAAAQRDAVDVTIEFNGPTKPVVIRPARNNDGMATLIMPLLAGR